MSILDKDSMMEDHWVDREYVVDPHSMAVHELYSQMRPLVEGTDSAVVMNTIMILVAMMGKQTDMTPEEFKAFVISELDRLMAVVEVDHDVQ
jgi:hypothetical protein